MAFLHLKVSADHDFSRLQILEPQFGRHLGGHSGIVRYMATFGGGEGHPIEFPRHDDPPLRGRPRVQMPIQALVNLRILFRAWGVVVT